MKKTLIHITNNETQETKTYRVVGMTHSGSRGLEYQLSPDQPFDGLIHTVCHAPPQGISVFKTSGNTYRIEHVERKG